MKNVYFVQVDVAASLGAQNAYLPYTAGILAAYAWSSEIVKKECVFKEFIFLREKIDAVVSRMENPAIIAFSNYVWNTEYNKALAEAVKEKYPHCLIVFGGHNVPDDFSYLEECDAIDILIHGEGEEPLKKLFEVFLQNEQLQSVPNISFRKKDGSFFKTFTRLPKTLDYPSPYLDGWFDDLIEKHPEITFNAILETSRGCPHRCAYCDWGLLKSKVRLFPLERIQAEIRWMAEHKIAFLWGADANFGLFKRDLEIADALVKAKETTGYPERMRINYAKDNYENVFAIVKKFKACNFDRIGATLSFQSLSPVVLENIGRSNSELEFYKNLLTKYRKENMRTYSELILGLPGETYESFIAGVGKLFEIGQHFVFEVYACILLPNAVLGQKETMEKYGIESVKAEITRPHFLEQEFDIPEYNRIITQTNTLTREMWVRSVAFSNVAKSFHGSGVLRIFAIYLFCEKSVPYQVFYDGIIDYLEANPGLFTSELYFEIKQSAREQSVGARSRKHFFEPCGDILWDDYEYMALQILNHFDEFYENMSTYLKSFQIADDIFNDLLQYQRSVLRRPNESEAILSLHYDVHGFISDAYVNKIHHLEKLTHQLRLTDSEPQNGWAEFSKTVVWYGRMGWSSYKDDISVLKDFEG